MVIKLMASFDENNNFNGVNIVFDAGYPPIHFDDPVKGNEALKSIKDYGLDMYTKGRESQREELLK